MLRSLTVALIFALCAGSLATAQTNIAGTWTLTLFTDLGTTEATMTFEQEGDELTATLVSEQGELVLVGTITGDDIELIGEIDAQGQVLVLTFTGKVDGSTMKGALDFGGFGGGDWSAVKNEA